MLRCYRNIIVAVAGLILVSATPQPHGKNTRENKHSQTEPSKRDPSIAFAPSQPVEVIDSTVLARPCEEGQDNRQSDLCAQWKAADAASKAAWWAAFGTMVALIGTVGLYWQIILTRRAVQDTGAATKAMEEANRLAGEAARLTRQAQRAWLSMNINPVEIAEFHGKYLLIFDIVIENVGTEATIVEEIKPSIEVVPVYLLGKMTEKNVIDRHCLGTDVSENSIPVCTIPGGQQQTIYRQVVQSSVLATGNDRPALRLIIQIKYSAGTTCSVFTITQLRGKNISFDPRMHSVDGEIVKLPIRATEIECEKYGYSRME